MVLSELERAFLGAASELTRRQHQLERLVSDALGRPAFDYWIRGVGRGDPTLDALSLATGGEWRFHFHGLEFDVAHVSDGRSVRVDFGPAGILAFTPGGVGAFVGATRRPWRTFPELQSFLEAPAGYDYGRCVDLAEALIAKGLISEAAPEVVALMKRHATFVPGRGHVVDIPARDRPTDETLLLLCDRLILTERARSLLGGISTAG